VSAGSGPENARAPTQARIQRYSELNKSSVKNLVLAKNVSPFSHMPRIKFRPFAEHRTNVSVLGEERNSSAQRIAYRFLPYAAAALLVQVYRAGCQRTGVR